MRQRDVGGDDLRGSVMQHLLLATDVRAVPTVPATLQQVLPRQWAADCPF